MKLRNQSETYLLSEITQAWSHYRHLEEMRTKYLSFFATIVLTSAGFLVTLLKDITKFESTHLIGSVSVFVFLVFLFTYFIWANISRIGYVLAAYETIMTETRRLMLGSNCSAFRLWAIRDRIPPAVSSGIFRIQLAASSMVLSVCVLLFGAEGYLAFVTVTGKVAQLPVILSALPIFFATCIAALIVHGLVRVRRAAQFQPPAMELSAFSNFEFQSGLETETDPKNKTSS